MLSTVSPGEAAAPILKTDLEGLKLPARLPILHLHPRHVRRPRTDAQIVDEGPHGALLAFDLDLHPPVHTILDIPAEIEPSGEMKREVPESDSLDDTTHYNANTNHRSSPFRSAAAQGWPEPVIVILLVRFDKPFE